MTRQQDVTLLSLGVAASPSWLATDVLLGMFTKQRKAARRKYAEFVPQGKGLFIWDKVANQVFLGDDDFVQRYLALLSEPDKLADIPKKQRGAVKTLTEYEHLTQTRDEAITTAYKSGG